MFAEVLSYTVLMRTSVLSNSLIPVYVSTDDSKVLGAYIRLSCPIVLHLNLFTGDEMKSPVSESFGLVSATSDAFLHPTPTITLISSEGNSGDRIFQPSPMNL